MHKSAVYTLVNRYIQGLTHRKQQRWYCRNCFILYP